MKNVNSIQYEGFLQRIYFVFFWDKIIEIESLRFSQHTRGYFLESVTGEVRPVLFVNYLKGSKFAIFIRVIQKAATGKQHS